MLKVTVDGVDYEYDQQSLMAREAATVQANTGFTVNEWVKALDASDANALIALVWLVWKRAGKNVSFNEVDFDLAKIKLENLDKADEAEVDPTVPAEPEQSEAVSIEN